ncbi:hypothetical protein HPB51_014894 [Rhipicephalus microplus]|uniref:Calponin-homology (CH) domain-containing protein n=1 Tax=Rhipicephalus microplus TaxID=6941 RepID=A0A9J6ESU0_RHIMP|nr:hypothetical protein HPB51_014894 [Rhipicephalus microplus]
MHLLVDKSFEAGLNLVVVVGCRSRVAVSRLEAGVVIKEALSCTSEGAWGRRLPLSETKGKPGACDCSTKAGDALPERYFNGVGREQVMGFGYSLRMFIYTDWANHYLERSRYKRYIQDLQSDVTDGVLLADVIDAVAGVKVPDINRKPKTNDQMEHLKTRQTYSCDEAGVIGSLQVVASKA